MKTFREIVFDFYKNKNKYSIYVKTPRPLYFKGVLVKDYVKVADSKYYSPTLTSLVSSIKISELGLLGKLKHLIMISRDY